MSFSFNSKPRSRVLPDDSFPNSNSSTGHFLGGTKKKSTSSQLTDLSGCAPCLTPGGGQETGNISGQSSDDLIEPALPLGLPPSGCTTRDNSNGTLSSAYSTLSGAANRLFIPDESGNAYRCLSREDSGEDEAADFANPQMAPARSAAARKKAMRCWGISSKVMVAVVKFKRKKTKTLMLKTSFALTQHSSIGTRDWGIPSGAKTTGLASPDGFRPETDECSNCRNQRTGPSPIRSATLEATGPGHVAGTSTAGPSGLARTKKNRKADEAKDDEFNVFCDQYAKFSPAIVHRYHLQSWQKTKRTRAKTNVDRFFATLFFADISGFTRLSARLNAEQLKYHVNTYFTRMIDVVRTYGGDIVKFCGDAVMILWPCDKAGSQTVKQANAFLAGLCALAMLRECGEYDVGKGRTAVSLRLHCGMGCGQLYGYYVGHEERWEYLIAGDALRQIGESESEATHGQTIVSPECWELMSSSFSADETPKHNWLLSGLRMLKDGKANRTETNLSMYSVAASGQTLTSKSTQNNKFTEEELEAAEETARILSAPFLNEILTAQYAGTSSKELRPLSKSLRAYVHESARHCIEARADDYIAELRRVTTMFINILGIEDGLQNGSLRIVQSVMQAGQDNFTKFGGTMRQFIVDDKGCVMIGAFGLPHFSHEDNDSRAIQAAQCMLTDLNGFGLNCQIGIAAGSVYCGYVGTNKRCEYAMMGCSVNLAARLMASAPKNTMQVDQEVFLGSENVFSFETLKPINAKGYEKPVQVYRPGQQVIVQRGLSFQQGVRHKGTEVVIGFVNEISLLKQSITDLKEGRRPDPIILKGPAGSGKSHLLQSTEIAEVLAACDAQALIGWAKNVHVNTPLYVWRRILHQFFGLQDDEENDSANALNPESYMEKMDQKRIIVERWLSKYTNLSVQEMAPLLSDICEVGLAETEITKNMDVQERSIRREEVLIELLRIKASVKPLVFVVENAQWMDSASWGLCGAMFHSDIRALIIFALRPLTEYFEEVPPEFSDLEKKATLMELGPLSAEDSLKLAYSTVGIETLRDHPEMLPPSCAELLLVKTTGNPLSVKNLILAFKDGFIAGNLKSLNEMPSGVFQDLIISRFDQLSSTQQRVLKTACILGGSKFSFKLLRHLVGDIGEDPDAETWESLSELVKAKIIQSEGEGDEAMFSIIQSSVQETVYKLMLNDQREKLHAACAQWYEENLMPHYSGVNLADGPNLGGADALAIMRIAHHWYKSGCIHKKMEYLEFEANNYERKFLCEEALQTYNNLLNLAFGTEGPMALVNSVKPHSADIALARPGRMSISFADIKRSLFHGRHNHRSRASGRRNSAVSIMERNQTMQNPYAIMLNYSFLDHLSLRKAQEFDNPMFTYEKVGYWIGKMAIAFYNRGKLASAQNHAHLSLMYLGLNCVPMNARGQSQLIARNRLSMLRSLGSKRVKATYLDSLKLQLYEIVVLVQLYRGQAKAAGAAGALIDYLVDTYDYSQSPIDVSRLNAVYSVIFLAQGNIPKATEYARRGEQAAKFCLKAGPAKFRSIRGSLNAYNSQALLAQLQMQGSKAAGILVYFANALILVATGQWDTSILTFNKVMDLNSKLGNLHRYGEAMCLKAYLTLGQGKITEALKRFSEIMENTSKNQDVFLRLTACQARALIYAFKGDSSKATQALEESTSLLAPQRSNMCANVIQCFLAVRRQDIPEAVQKLDYCVPRLSSQQQTIFTSGFFLHMLSDAMFALLELYPTEIKDNILKIQQYMESLLKVFTKLGQCQPPFACLADLAKARFLHYSKKEAAAVAMLDKVIQQSEKNTFHLASKLATSFRKRFSRDGDGEEELRELGFLRLSDGSRSQRMG